mgnify:CR=1 FL=1
MSNNWVTRSMPHAYVNRVLTVKLMSEVMDAKNGKSALCLLSLLIWKRKLEKNTFNSITNSEWKKHTGKNRQAKYLAGKSLQDMGLVKIRSEGKQSLSYKLASRVDPLSEEKKYKKAKAASHTSPGMVAGDEIIKNIKSRL